MNLVSTTRSALVGCATLLLAMAAAAPAAFANSADHSFQLWSPIYLDAPVGRQNIRGYFEVNPRLNDNLEGLNQLIVRPGLGLRFNRHVTAFGGYAWITNYSNGFLQEQRVWQQVGIGHRLLPKLILFHRFRLEERFIQHTHGDAAIRFRYFLRGEVPIFKTRNYAVAYDELFVNLNDVRDAVRAGIDQNRIYGGVGRKLAKNLRAEVAYQQQYVNGSDIADDKARHILMTSFFLDF